MFKWDPSEFPELDEINKTVDPYLSLFTLVREWRTLEKTLMDGDFVNLDAEITRDKVSNVMYMRVRVIGFSAKLGHNFAGLTGLQWTQLNGFTLFPGRSLTELSREPNIGCLCSILCFSIENLLAVNADLNVG